MTPLFGKPLEPGAPKYTAAFEAFWELSSMRGSKLAAFKAFERLRPAPDQINAMIAAQLNWRGSEQWRLGIIPHVSTWLNRRGWEEIVPKKGRNSDERETRAEEIVRKNHEAGERVRNALRRATGDSEGDGDFSGADGLLCGRPFDVD